MLFLPYNKNLRDFSRELRSNSTLSEVLLWNKLKSAQMHNYTFNRQKPLDNYIVDFYCKPLNLVIEIDGNSHQMPNAYLNDETRQKILEQMGLNFLRFDDAEIKKQMEHVIRIIENYILDFEEKLPVVKLKKRNSKTE
jgi:very-short-patch-repair endonuclease